MSEMFSDEVSCLMGICCQLGYENDPGRLELVGVRISVWARIHGSC
jgi:hypothetical protein